MSNSVPFLSTPDPEKSGLGAGRVGAGKRLSQAQFKATEFYQLELWSRWPKHENWPGTLCVDEAAAYLRISPHWIRKSVVKNREEKSELPHQRLGTSIRIKKSDLDRLGQVLGQDE